jgi:hypothetical protein
LLRTIYAKVTLDDLCTSLAFINALHAASLDGGLEPETLAHLPDPPQSTLSLGDDDVLRAAVKLYLKLFHAQKDYEYDNDVINII